MLTISGTGAIADYSDTSEIPWKDQKKTITKIVIENGITEIGIQAFYDCTNVTEVVFPDTLTTIKRGAFFSVTVWKQLFCQMASRLWSRELLQNAVQ